MPGGETIHRSEPGKSHRMELTRRIEQREKRRQERDAAQERDDHAGPRDLAELGEPDVVGRHERRKSGHDRNGGERQRDTRLESSASQSFMQFRMLMALAAVSHAELDREIDPEPHEQHEKRDRDQVEGPDQSQPCRRGDRQAERERHHDRRDGSDRSQRQQEDDDHKRNRHCHGDPGILADRAELIVVHGDRAGLAHPCLKRGGEAEVRRNARDRFSCGMTGPQRAEIEDRLHLDEPPQVLRRRRLAIGERAPGKARRTGGKDRVGGVGGHVQGHHEIVELELTELDARQRERKRAQRSPQTGIGRQRADERIGAAQFARDLGNLRLGEEQQAVPLEEGAAARFAHGKKTLRMLA